MKVRPFNHEQDYPMICEWWTKHKAPILPLGIFLPAYGLLADSVAVAWLFVCEGTQGGIGLIEFTTTNPAAPLRERSEGVKKIYSALESLAKEKGCGSLMALVGENSSERHLMDKVGFANMGGIPHLLYGKVLTWPSPS